MFGCKYLNFSRSASLDDLISRRVIKELEGTSTPENLDSYSDPDTAEYQTMVDTICKKMNFTSLRYHRLDDMVESVGLPKCRLCTYCWNGEE